MTKIFFPKLPAGTGEILDRNLGVEYLGGPSIRGWSKISTYMICDRMYFYEGIKKYRPKKASDALDIGTLFHACMAAHYFTGGKDTWVPLDAVNAERPEIAVEVKRLLEVYFSLYAKDERDTWDIRAVEHEVIGSMSAEINGQMVEAPVSCRFDLMIAQKEKDQPPAPYGIVPQGVYIVDHKCVPGIAELNTNLGIKSAKQVYDLIACSVPVKLLSYDSTTNRLEYNSVMLASTTSPKQIYDLVTRSGCTTSLGQGHPVLTKRGYVEVQDLLATDIIGTCGSVSVNNDVVTVRSKKYLQFLGAYIADGNQNNKQLLITKNDAKHMTFVSAAITSLGGDGKFWPATDRPEVLKCKINIGLLPTFIEDCLGGKSINRYFGNEILSLSVDDVKHLLGAMWSGDGAVYTVSELGREKARICYTTRSDKLAVQVKFFLARLGLLSTIQKSTVEYDGKRVPYNQVTIVGRESKLSFLEMICSEEIYCPRLRDSAVRVLIVQFNKKAMGKNPKLDGDLYWDKIKTIEVTGIEPCYEFTVDKVHTFTVGGVVTHNCMARMSQDLIDGYGLDGQFLLMAHLWRQQKLDEVFGKLNGFIINVITKTKYPECKRISVAIDDGDVARFVETLSPVVAEMHYRVNLREDASDVNSWPMNFAVCKNPRGYGKCKFFDLCQSHGKLTELYEIAPWSKPSAQR